MSPASLPWQDWRWPPSREAAVQRVAEIEPQAYGASRNHLAGAVTGLSPYITHGLLTVPSVLAQCRARHADASLQPLAFQLAWREYFHHVWRHLGEAIFSSLQPGVLPEGAYACSLPPDLREGRTGVPVIDQAVHALYRTGYLHNHARLWLASYTVHLRKVHWRVGADWLYAHLLDGDLASNHLSWQWVAGTGSHKPYLLNADNVARFAPPAWHSPGTVIDTSYDALQAKARQEPEPGAPKPAFSTPSSAAAAPPKAVPVATVPRHWVQGRTVWLVHPWDLADPPPEAAQWICIGVLDAEFHTRWPWSAQRWAFVHSRMSAITPQLWWGSSTALLEALAGAAAVLGRDNLHLDRRWRAAWPGIQPAARAFADPDQRCASFSAFWRQVQPPADEPSSKPQPWHASR